MECMDNQTRLRYLEARRRDIVGMAVVCKAHYLALNGELSSTPVAIERARTEWQNLEAEKVAVAFRIKKLQELNEESAELSS
jgi:hypothetical protein